VPDLVKDLLEEISFAARDSEFIDEKSGISARMSITAFENLMSTAERRMLICGESQTAIRFGDLMGIIPAITGKVELVYEGEQEGAAFVAKELIGDATKNLFLTYFPKIEKLTKETDKDPYEEVLAWFFEQSGFVLEDDLSDADYKQKLDSITPLTELIKKHLPDTTEADSYFMKEFVLWALVEFKKLSKYELSNGMRFNDLYGSYISGLS